MLGCTLTNEPASQMNWAVGDRKISMNKKKLNLDTPGSKICRSPHGSFGLKFSLIKFKSITSLKYLKDKVYFTLYVYARDSVKCA